MPSRIDEAGHTKAFDYPVAEHWGGGIAIGNCCQLPKVTHGRPTQGYVWDSNFRTIQFGVKGVFLLCFFIPCVLPLCPGGGFQFA